MWTPREAAAFYALGLVTSEDLPELATEWLCNGLDSQSMRVLAGESAPIMSDVAPLFEAVLNELSVELPDEGGAVLVVLEVYLRQIVSGAIDPFEGMALIQNHLGGYFYDTSTKFLGDGIGIERMHTWYRELQDAEDGSTLFYYIDLPREEAVLKFREHLMEEARRRLDAFEA